MKVFKFGGASVKDAEAVRNVADIINLYSENLVIVVSAMGKTTNAMEEIAEAYFSRDKVNIERLISNVIDFHNNIIRALELPKLESIETIFNNLNQKVSIKGKLSKVTKEGLIIMTKDEDQKIPFSSIIQANLIM